MKIHSAISYSLSAAILGFLGELWHVHRDKTYYPELGLVGAAIGLTLFGVLYTILIYEYGSVSQRIRKDTEPVSAPVLSGIMAFFQAL